jgi:hypothetical protein
MLTYIKSNFVLLNYYEKTDLNQYAVSRILVKYFFITLQLSKVNFLFYTIKYTHIFFIFYKLFIRKKTTHFTILKEQLVTYSYNSYICKETSVLSYQYSKIIDTSGSTKLLTPILPKFSKMCLLKNCDIYKINYLKLKNFFVFLIH